MQSRTAILFKVLLNRFHPGTGEAFLKTLPQDDIKDIMKQTVSSEDPAKVITWKNDLISHTHYSWLAPVIQKLPKEIQGPTIASLPEPQCSRLKGLLNIKSIPIQLSQPVKDFLIDQLFHSWQPLDIVPRQYIPQSSLNSLLDFSKASLVELIDLLSMHDLAEAIRHIVDKKNLKKIYLCLAPTMQQYLRICLHQKEKVAAPKLEIEKWNGDPQKLKQLLHRRGIFRLGNALAGQSTLFMWHLTHILDTGRALTLSKYYHNKETPGVTSLLVQQVQYVMNFIKKKSAP